MLSQMKLAVVNQLDTSSSVVFLGYTNGNSPISSTLLYLQQSDSLMLIHGTRTLPAHSYSKWS